MAWSLAVAAGRARSPTPPEEEAADGAESQVEIDVDGVTVSFKTMRLYGRVSGWAAVKDVTVSYVSRGVDVPRIGLAEITGLEPYLEGYRELMRDKGIELGTRTTPSGVVGGVLEAVGPVRPGNDRFWVARGVPSRFWAAFSWVPA